MINLLFICYGNICRSTMAESLCTHKVKKLGLQNHFHIDSAATSTEELGNPPYPNTVQELQKHGIPVVPHRSRQLTANDGKNFDYIIGMDSHNLSRIRKMTGIRDSERVFRLLDLTDEPRDVADPWYTRRFDVTYADLDRGLDILLERLIRKHGLRPE